MVGQQVVDGIFIDISGSGPAVLLLHGFPESHLMWRDVAPALARNFTVVCADLPGYGQSHGPPVADPAAYSKRAIAGRLVSAMRTLGFPRFAVAGHDRGGRVAYRMALDHPSQVVRLAVLDIIPTLTAWERADARFALGFWPWTLLAQPSPLPERLLAADAEAVLQHTLTHWGTPASVFPADVRAAYLASLRDARHVKAICEEYRAAAGIDVEHDRADRAAGRKIGCPTVVLWSAVGPLATWYGDALAPLAIWRDWCDDVRGEALEGGHFFPEERPAATASALLRFLLEGEPRNQP